MPFVETFRRSASVLIPLLLAPRSRSSRAWIDRDRVRLRLGAIAAALMIAVAR